MTHCLTAKGAIKYTFTLPSATYDPDSKPPFPSAYNDEFETGLLDPKWTAFNCASGTVDLLTTAAAADIWDATTYTGIMALQPGRDDAGAAGIEAEAAMIRQTVVLGATCKVVAKVRCGLTADALEAIPPSGIGIMLSGVNGFDDNDFLLVGLGPDPAAPLVGWGISRIGGGGFTALGQSMPPSGARYVMITKTGNNFSAFVGDGESWAALTDAAAPDNTVFAYGAGVMVRLTIGVYWPPAVAEVNLFNPIGTCDFVRYFTNNTPLVNA